MGALANSSDQMILDDIANKISKLIAAESGNILGAQQRPMVLNKIRRRMMELKKTPQDYYQYMTAHLELEKKEFLTLLTIHHSFFFREFCHFEYLQNNLETLVQAAKKRGDNTIKIYTAACSRGQESYSLALFFDHHLKVHPGISFKIFGTDIDSESVKTAKNGVYPYDDVKSIPGVYLNGNWQRGTGKIANYAKVKPHIKERCSFAVGNLLHLDSGLVGKKFDLIFCRNVFIYFSDENICKVCQNFSKHLYAGGLLVTGLSESLKQMNSLKVNSLAPSVYSFGEQQSPMSPPSHGLFDSKPKKAVEVASPTNSPGTSRARLPSIPKPIRMLIVDDSASIVKLLTRIFSTDSDFQVVGTAQNGLEAEDFLKSNTVDAMTLDIHMPEMNGVEYLRKNHNNAHPKVVVVTSASREDTKFAQKTIKYGASDLVEKPALNNLEERAEEIKMKLKMSFLNDQGLSTNNFDSFIERQFKIEAPENKSRIIFANFSDRKRLVNFFKEMKGEVQPSTFLVIEGNANYLDLITEEFANENLQNFCVLEETNPIVAGQGIYLVDFATKMNEVKSFILNRRTSVCVFGQVSDKVSELILGMDKIQLLLEDVDGLNPQLRDVASDLFPWTSFSHVSTEYLAGDES